MHKLSVANNSDFCEKLNTVEQFFVVLKYFRRKIVQISQIIEVCREIRKQE